MTAPAAGPDTFDWEPLRVRAREAMAHAYVPYSDYPVGVAARVDDGRTVTGCNVENASYGLSLCAECGLISQLQLGGGGRLTHFTCVDGRGESLVPCGRCRQLLYEFGGPELLLDTPGGIVTMAELLPQPFGPAHLA
ncbi:MULTISPECIES: cytidine deaminase [Streptomyces]|uniref:Cytidine deaminase n=1 Tax=Streptomyces tsukubensis (strain DSM 42081 / NBRC 108919 / NRRL 18488 / 9993) TaxID=1114943 RepID=I2N4W3_STRT9|nr:MULTISPECIES: cytidine deaminase [Streptomyces]AZK96102.1 cytidine deaminase [Streptomyces tsukubensis]EIF92060.1 cytidine deaminase [Streptomyces tsukubensis NRRL18488]MYS63761.1 cytidine deaminase [Streptomyces sp. SID5473]QKM67880.1 cytidine deaminase [Streptomyces tsukubensis NRRL18488]TAI44275.1 cytidine deaminase [Streptomyces tsukubensis]